MKRKITILLALIIVLLLAGCGASSDISSSISTPTLTPTPTPTPSTGFWELKYYVDEFKQPTKNGYIEVNTSTGTFSNSATTDSSLSARLVVDKEKVCIFLYEYGDMLVKNPYSQSQDYDITIKDKDGEKLTFHGIIYSGADRLCFWSFYAYEHTEEEAREMIAKGGEVSFYIVEQERQTTSYLFTVDCTGYNEAYKLLG